MGRAQAIEPIKTLLGFNLNGISATGGSGSGWSGRPDAVALAKLGDDSGIPVLVKAAKEDDRINVLPDFEAIGRKELVPHLLPALSWEDEDKLVEAARVVINLLATE
jgi:hypothetical protein